MSYSELIISDSPIGYWELDNWRPLNINLISTSSLTYATQYPSQVIQSKSIISGIDWSTRIGSSTSSIVIPNNSSILTVGNERVPATMELWFSVSTTSSNTYSLIKSSYSSGSYSLFQCYLINDKLWIETEVAKDYIEILSLQNQQYLSISYLNGKISMNLNGAEQITVPCSSSFTYNQDTFILGPANSSGSIYFNSFAVYKYILNNDQVSKRIDWANRNGSYNLISTVNSRSSLNTDITQSTSYKYDILTKDFYDTSFSNNLIFDNNSIRLQKLDQLEISSSIGVVSPSYTLDSNGIKFNTSSEFAYLDLSKYNSFFNDSYSTVRLQISSNSTSSGNILTFLGFTNYQGLNLRVKNNSTRKLELSLIDLYGNQTNTITSGSLSDGVHDVAINFSSSSITLYVDSSSISTKIPKYLMNGNISSIVIGSNLSIKNSISNAILNSNGWAVASNTSASLENSYEYYYNDDNSLKIINVGTGSVSIGYFNNGTASSLSLQSIPVTASKTYYSYGYVRPMVSSSYTAAIRYYDQSFNFISLSTSSVTQVTSSTSWTSIYVTASAPASAAYAVPFFTASVATSNASIYWDSMGFNVTNIDEFAIGYNNYIKNFGIDSLTTSSINYSSTAYFMLKFNNNLNISQKGTIQNFLMDKNQYDSVIDATLTYSNQSSNVNIEHGKSSSSAVTWYQLSNNYPLINYDYGSISNDEIKITLTTDDSYNDITSLNYLNIKYHTASYLSTTDALFTFNNEKTYSSSLSNPIVNDTNINIFSKTNNLGLKVVPNITGGIKISPNASVNSYAIKAFDCLFTINKYSSASSLGTIFHAGSTCYITTSSNGLISIVNSTGSVYLDGASAVSQTLQIGEPYHLSVIFNSSVSYIWLGYDQTNLINSEVTYGNINVYSSSGQYSTDALNYSSKIYSNYKAVNTKIFGNNLVSEQNSSAELFNELSGSWGFRTINASATQSSASSVHGLYSIKIAPSTSASISLIASSSTTSLTPILPGREYLAMAKIASTVSRSSRCNIIWYSNDNISSSISISSGSSIATSSSWNNYIVTASAPLNSNYAAVSVTIDSASTTDSHYVDELGIFAKNVTNWNLSNSNNLDISDGNVQTSTDTSKNYFSLDGNYFEMKNLPKIKIISKRSSNTNI